MARQGEYLFSVNGYELPFCQCEKYKPNSVPGVGAPSIRKQRFTQGIIDIKRPLTPKAKQVAQERYQRPNMPLFTMSDTKREANNPTRGVKFKENVWVQLYCYLKACSR